jgi:hypothetical protein
MIMQRPDDCPDLSGNGAGCLGLQDCIREQGQLSKRLAHNEARVGQLKVSVDAAKDAADRSEAAANKSAAGIARIEAFVCKPANTMLSAYSDASELMDAAEEENMPTSVSAQIPHLAIRRIKREEVGRLEAEKRAEALGAEKERIRAAAELETKRVAEANRLAVIQIEREKRNAKLIHAAIGAIVTLAGVATTYLASRGH